MARSKFERTCEVCSSSFMATKPAARFCKRACVSAHFRTIKTGPKPRPIVERFWEHVDKNGPTVRAELGPCWMWTAARTGRGYGKILAENSRTLIGAHCVSWDLHRGQPRGNLFVMHRCDNRACVNPDHLQLGTHLDNMQDMAAKGRSTKGTPNATSEQIAEIRSRVNAGETQAQMARDYSLDRNTVWNIVHGRLSARAAQP